ncbi:MAG: hypothetical protein R3B72_07835 [Polyangiaceae bacterium]
MTERWGLNLGWGLGVCLAVGAAASCVEERPERLAGGAMEVDVTPQVASTARPARAPHPLTSVSPTGSALLLSEIGGRRVLLVADADRHAVGVLDAASLERVSQLTLTGSPSQMVVAGDGRLWVALRDRAQVVVLEVSDPTSLALEVAFEIATPAEPVALARDAAGERVAVATGWTATLASYEVRTRQLERRVALPREPRGVTIPEGSRFAYVSHALGSTISKVALDAEEAPEAIPLSGSDQSHSGGGCIVRAVNSDRRAAQGFALASLDGEVFAPGVLVHRGDEPVGGYGTSNQYPPHQPVLAQVHPRASASSTSEARRRLRQRGAQRRAGEMALAQSNPRASASSTSEARRRRQSWRNGAGTIEPRASASSTSEARRRLRQRGAQRRAGEMALAQSKQDAVRLRVMNAAFAAAGGRTFFSGGARRDGCFLPRAVAVDPVHHNVLVSCLGTDEVLAFSARGGALSTSAMGRWQVPAGPVGIAVDAPAAVAYVWSQFAHEVSRIALPGALPEGPPSLRYPAKPSAPEATAKLELDGGPTHLSALAEAGRRLFHGAGDARISQDGRACASCHPDGRDDGLTWPTPNGPRQTPMLAGRLHDATKPFGWQGDTDTVAAHVSQTFTRLGGKGLDEREMASLMAYLTEMATPPRLAPTDLDPGAVARGKAIFHSEMVGCAVCHTDGGLGSDGARHAVGSGPELETPALGFVVGTAPYFHDGRYATLGELLRETKGKMGWGADLGDDDLAALEAYLLTL